MRAEDVLKDVFQSSDEVKALKGDPEHVCKFISEAGLFDEDVNVLLKQEVRNRTEGANANTRRGANLKEIIGAAEYLAASSAPEEPWEKRVEAEEHWETWVRDLAEVENPDPESELRGVGEDWYGEVLSDDDEEWEGLIGC